MLALPEETPDTTPVLFTAATEVLLLLQVPPVTTSLSVVDEPAHMALLPVMVPETGNGLTVASLLATEVPQPLVTR